MVSPSMILATTYISDLAISQDNLLDGQKTTVAYSFKLQVTINDGTTNDFILDLPQYRYYYNNYNQQADISC